jgi:hypothetical protein
LFPWLWLSVVLAGLAEKAGLLRAACVASERASVSRAKGTRFALEDDVEPASGERGLSAASRTLEPDPEIEQTGEHTVISFKYP